MAQNVFKNYKPVNHASRNGFDLSRRQVFSTKCGLITPMFVQYTLPNSDYRIDLQQLLRTQPLQTAAFTGFSVNYDFAFVPFNQMYSSFNQFIAQRTDAFLANQPSRNHIPMCDIGAIIWKYRFEFLYDFIVSEFSDNGYNTNYVQNVNGQTVYVPYCHFRSLQKDGSMVPDIIRALDMFGFTNLLPYFKRLKDIWFQGAGINGNWYDFCRAVAPALAQGADAMRQTFDVWYRQDWVTDYPFKLPIVNLFAPMAYCKMFHEYYRNVYYDLDFSLLYILIGSQEIHKQEEDYKYAELFNFDDYTSVVGADSSLYDHLRVMSMLSLFPHQYRRDMFTGVLPSQQYGNVSMIQDASMWHKLYAGTFDAAVNGDTSSSQSGVVFSNFEESTGNFNLVEIERGDDGDSANMDYFRFDPVVAFDVLTERRANALQRFKERMLRAGDRTKDIFKAHGWEEPKSEYHHQPTFLGSFDGRLDINTVAATNSSDTVELGQLGANGVAVVSGEQIRVHTSDFGVIIGVCYIVKDSEYNAFGVDRQLCLSEPFDFPYPELQNITLQPLVYKHLSALAFDSPMSPPISGPNNIEPNQVLGYLPGFIEYKTAIDKVHGEFCSGDYSWDMFLDERQANVNTFNGVFSDWVTPRRSTIDATSLKFMYQQKDIVDNVFLMAQNSHQWTDPFLINCYISCSAVEPLSVIGLPV